MKLYNMLILLLFCSTCIIVVIGDVPVAPVEWDVLAPFPFAYRELGADPLEAFGGITNIARADNSLYPSELIDGGKVNWTKVYSPNGGAVQPAFAKFVNWDLLGNSLSPAGQLWQGWALGDFIVNDAGLYLLQCVDGDFTQTFTQSMIWVDDVMMNGNTVGYSFPWYPINLTAGKHTLRVKISGGADSESFTCRFGSGTFPFMVISGDDNYPDIVNSQFVSNFASIPILNTMNNMYLNNINVTVLGGTQPITITVAPGQIMPITINLPNTTLSCTATNNLIVNFKICASSQDNRQSACINHNITFNCKTFGKDPAYMFTFLDFDQAVHYAALMPPSSTCDSTIGCSILLAAHGCGVRAESGAWTGAYQTQNQSWILLPTGRREVGFDWEGPGTLNVFSALQYFVDNLPGVPTTMKSNYKPNKNRILFAGHSMGGHGTLNLASHFPDLAIGLAPAAGWIKWEHYVPYFTRLGDSWIDPFLQSILYSSIAEHDTDLHTPNLIGLPFLVRMGSEDDTVPPWNLRRMARLVDQLSTSANFVSISEIPGQGHWFNGVVDDAIMQDFFDGVVTGQNTLKLPGNFSVVCMNPRTFGSRGGVKVLQHIIPYRIARMEVQTGADFKTWVVTTENVRRFGFEVYDTRSYPQPTTQLQIDGQILPFYGVLPGTHYCRTDTNPTWSQCTGPNWSVSERGPNNYGPARQVLEDDVIIVYGTLGTAEETAQFVSFGTWLANDLYHTGRFGIQVIADNQLDSQTGSSNNLILLGGPNKNIWAQKLAATFPMKFTSTGGFSLPGKSYNSPSTGALFLSPHLSGVQKVVLVLAGTDMTGFQKATQLFPTHTGHMVPDFVIAGPNFGWAGSAGLLAAGYWDNQWNYDDRCGYTK